MSLADVASRVAIVLALTASASAARAVENNHGPQQDPNLPPIGYMTDAPLFWSYGSGTVPSVSFKGYPFSKDPSNAAEALYLGFNENGSLIRNSGNGKVYSWKLRNSDIRSGSLTEAAKSFFDIPVDTLATLQNPSSTTKGRLEIITKAAQPPTIPQPPPPPPNPDKSGGLFGNNPRSALQGLAPAAGSPADIAGKNASIQGGVLTFTMADGNRSKPYTVVRPTFMANPPPATGVMGTWVAMESGGKGMMFNVQADNSLTGKEISPQVVQMLMQAAPKPR
jgi:hypothetical protein